MRQWFIQYWLAVLFGTLTGALGWAVKHVWQRQKTQETKQRATQEAQGNEQGAIKDGLQALLHDRIYQSCGDCECKGYADVRDRENLEYLYRPYHSLGGNGTGTDLYNRAKELPTIKPAEMEIN